jgi:carboxymethylenebutenolidase
MSETSETIKSLSLPAAPAISVSPAVTVQPPLSRAGKGPALIILVNQDAATKASIDSIDPPPLQKWAEESFVVAQLDLYNLQTSFKDTLSDTISFIKDLPSFDGNEKFGVICSSYISIALTEEY